MGKDSCNNILIPVVLFYASIIVNELSKTLDAYLEGKFLHSFGHATIAIIAITFWHCFLLEVLIR